MAIAVAIAFAQVLEDAGAKVGEIQAQRGHKSLQTTGRYLAQPRLGEIAPPGTA